MPILGKLTKMKVLTVIGKFDDVTAPMWKDPVPTATVHGFYFLMPRVSKLSQLSVQHFTTAGYCANVHCTVVCL